MRREFDEHKMSKLVYHEVADALVKLNLHPGFLADLSLHSPRLEGVFQFEF